MKRIDPELRELARVVYSNSHRPVHIHIPSDTDTSFACVTLVQSGGLSAHCELRHVGPRYGDGQVWHREDIGTRITHKIRAIAEWLDYYGFDLSRWEVIQ